jgi:hypothetical protein
LAPLLLLLPLLQTVLDHQQVFWEFLCTCYGCQYALSRVGEQQTPQIVLHACAGCTAQPLAAI